MSVVIGTAAPMDTLGVPFICVTCPLRRVLERVCRIGRGPQLLKPHMTYRTSYHHCGNPFPCILRAELAALQLAAD